MSYLLLYQLRDLHDKWGLDSRYSVHRGRLEASMVSALVLESSSSPLRILLSSRTFLAMRWLRDDFT
jgi:hypothetical protein